MSATDPNVLLRDWWNNSAPAVFSHISYGGYLGSEAKQIKVWGVRWLSRTCGERACVGERVVEYGIGGGLLAENLLATQNVSHYAGVDIAARQREHARARLEKLAESSGRRLSYSLHDTDVSFRSLAPSLFISIAVIQHFPTAEYTAAWLARVDACGAARVVLQTRAGRRPSWWSRRYNISDLLAKTRRIKYATVLTTGELSAALPSYSLEWESRAYENNIKFYAFRLKA